MPIQPIFTFSSGLWYNGVLSNSPLMPKYLNREVFFNAIENTPKAMEVSYVVKVSINGFRYGHAEK